MSFILLGILNSQVSGVAPTDGVYDLLETTVLGSDQSSVTFDNLDTVAANYKHLQIRATASATASSNSSSIFTRFNSDSGSNYAWHRLLGLSSSVLSYNFTSQNEINTMFASGDQNAANVYGVAVIDILDFQDTSKNTTVRSLNGVSQPNTPGIGLNSGLYLSTNAITSIEMLRTSDNIEAGSRFSLYGIKAA